MLWNCPESSLQLWAGAGLGLCTLGTHSSSQGCSGVGAGHVLFSQSTHPAAWGWLTCASRPSHLKAADRAPDQLHRVQSSGQPEDGDKAILCHTDGHGSPFPYACLKYPVQAKSQPLEGPAGSRRPKAQRDTASSPSHMQRHSLILPRSLGSGGGHPLLELLASVHALEGPRFCCPQVKPSSTPAHPRSSPCSPSPCPGVLATLPPHSWL